MAWDDAAPTPTELAPVTGGWDAAPPTADELKAGPSLSEFGHNAWEDVKSNVKGVGSLAKGLLTHPVDTAEAIPGALLNEAKRVGGGYVSKEAPFIHPITGTEQLGKAFYEKPVSTALDAATVASLGSGAATKLGLLGKAGEAGEAAAKVGELAGEAAPLEKAAEVGEAAEKAAPAAEEMARVAPKAPEPVNIPGEAGNILKNMPPTPQPEEEVPAARAAATKVPLMDRATQVIDDATQKANEVKDYVSRGYEGFAKKPGNIANVADYVQEKSQMMAAQQLGATPLQARQVGHPAMRAIGQYAIDNDIVSPTTGLKGMRAKNTELLNATGKQINAYRSMADKAAPAYQPGELLKQVKAQLDQKYLRGVTPETPSPRGVHGAEAGAYQKALQEVEDAEATHSGAAKTATLLNKAANEANRLNQPHNAYTDVANALSDINNQRIIKAIGPQNAAKYDQALREFGVNKKISEMLKRKEAGEVKRFGPGSVTSNLTQKLMDEVGYRTGAKVANKVSTSILKNPAIGKSLPSLFKEFINQVEEVGHDVTGMAEGGYVAPEIAEYVRSR